MSNSSKIAHNPEQLWAIVPREFNLGIGDLTFDYARHSIEFLSRRATRQELDRATPEILFPPQSSHAKVHPSGRGLWRVLVLSVPSLELVWNKEYFRSWTRSKPDEILSVDELLRLLSGCFDDVASGLSTLHSQLVP